MVRLDEDETDAELLPSNAQGFFLSTLLTKETLPLFAIEMAGPAYAIAPDVIPGFLTAKRTKTRLGELDRLSGIWYLDRDAVSHIALSLTSGLLASAYFLDIHEAFGRPVWLDLIAEGRRISFPARSGIAWECVLHRLRATREPVAIYAPQGIDAIPFVANRLGEELPVEWIVRGS